MACLIVTLIGIAAGTLPVQSIELPRPWGLVERCSTSPEIQAVSHSRGAMPSVQKACKPKLAVLMAMESCSLGSSLGNVMSETTLPTDFIQYFREGRMRGNRLKKLFFCPQEIPSLFVKTTLCVVLLWRAARAGVIFIHSRLPSSVHVQTIRRAPARAIFRAALPQPVNAAFMGLAKPPN